MSEGILRSAPTGEIVGLRGVVVMPQIAVAASSTGSGSFTFDGVDLGDSIRVNARVSLGNVSAPQIFRSAANTINLVFATGGAALTIPSQSIDVEVDKW
jgi:hypothetical protein